jgi:hyperosmotically inducible protein
MRARIIATVPILGLVLVLSTAAAQKKPPELGHNAPATPAMAAVAREVRHELLMLPYYGVFDWLQYQVQPDGAVVLEGEVTKPTTKSRAEHVVQKVEGVTRVENDIKVLPLSPSDDRLRIALYRAVYSGPLFRYQVGSLNTIHIIVDHGHVVLKGQVSSSGDRTIATARANQVSGVFSVENQLQVVKEDEDE